MGHTSQHFYGEILTCHISSLAYKIPVVATGLIIDLQSIHLDAVLPVLVVVWLPSLPMLWVIEIWRQGSSGREPLILPLLFGVGQPDPELVPHLGLPFDPCSELKLKQCLDSHRMTIGCAIQ